jgi:TRAP-type C4-dicarboxylate transport system permease small subunit
MLARASTYLSFLALFCACAGTGFTISFNDQYMKNMVDIMYPGMPLPGLSLFILYLEKFVHPATSGPIMGIIFVIILVVLDRNPRTQKWLSVCLTIGWGLCVLYLVAAIWAIALLLPIKFTHI